MIKHQLAPNPPTERMQKGILIHDLLAMRFHRDGFGDRSDETRRLQEEKAGDPDVMRMLDEYEAFLRESPFKGEFVSAEESFELPLGSGLYFGRIDLVYRHNDGGMVVVDHKTTAMARAPAWLVTNQVLGYAWAVEQLYNEPVVAVEWQFILMPKKYATSFERRMVLIEPWMLEEWRIMMENVMEDLNAAVNDPNFSACVQWGHTVCPFVDMCMTPPDQRSSVFRLMHGLQQGIQVDVT